MHPQLLTAGLSDIGRRRESNEDNFLVADVTRSLQITGTSLPFSPGSRVYGHPLARLILVADGMGGHQAGARASTQAIESIVRNLLESRDGYELSNREHLERFGLHLGKLFRMAHLSLESASKSSPSQKGMGTTLTLVYLSWPRMIVVHAGDSRCYLLRNNHLKLLTRDHTIANQLVSRGELREADAASSPWGNMLWNVLGGGGMEVQPEVCYVDLQMEDWILICTDGLNKHLSDQEIAEKFHGVGDPALIANRLIQSANSKGGSDNITAVITRVAEVPADSFSDYPRSTTTILEAPSPEGVTENSSPTIDIPNTNP